MKIMAIKPAMLAALFTYAPDPELVLTTSLLFHHSVWSCELQQLAAADVLRLPGGRPVSFWIRGNRSRIIPIAAGHQEFIGGLLPVSGPLFLAGDPFSHLRRFAARQLGFAIHSQECVRACALHAVAIGQSVEVTAARAGMSVAWLRAQLLSTRPISPQQAKSYWQAGHTLERIAILPLRTTNNSNR